jgi:4-amino-4-deoxy-L-arabinose transferase-like glycosyltransferase
VRRPFSWRAGFTPSGAAFGLLLALAVSLWIAFSWNPGLATVADDSVSYLLQARVLAGDPDPSLRQWYPHVAHFPPLFPLLLAATGAAHDFARAHLVVALCAGLALLAVRSFAATVVAGSAATGLALLLVLMPTAWINELGILTEPLFVALTFCALWLHARAQPASARMRWLLGFVMAAAVLTRSAGVALVLAYCAWAALRAVRREEALARLALPLVPVVVLVGMWMWLRPPLQGDAYGGALHREADLILHHPGFFFGRTLRFVADGWVAGFTSESHVHPAVRAFFLSLGVMSVAGALRAALRNRLDGWYALAYVAMLLLWLFNEETMRRLIYPVLPLLLLHAGEILYVGASRLLGPRAGWAPAIAGMVAAVLALPALLLIGDKSRDRAQPFEHTAQSLASITEYYTYIAVKPAREIAGRHLAVLAGLEAIDRVTPPDARVMWMRPDYIAVVAHRRGVPWFYREGLASTLRRVHEEDARYIVISSLYKSDMMGEADEPQLTADVLAPFAHPLYVVNNPSTPQPEFALFEFDRAAVAQYVAAHRAASAATPRR